MDYFIKNKIEKNKSSLEESEEEKKSDEKTHDKTSRIAKKIYLGVKGEYIDRSIFRRK